MKKTAFALLLTLLIAGGAFAQLDPDADGIGIYFDPCACVNCLDLPVGNNTGYVVITHPSSDAGVAGWEATITNEGPGVMSNWQLQGDATNTAVNSDEFIVNLGTPLTNAYSYPAVIVAMFNLNVVSVEAPITFYIDGIEDHSILDYDGPAFVDGNDNTTVKPLQMIQGSASLPVALVNGNCAGIVARGSTTLDNMKALFR
ncbi:hypothetical protein CSA17_02205 [bacterium DOLJORAL78_65_58]|nr:MAG: hypothetical protein CSB20_06345 [bacterium DOLZORAL124_64_63]PIE76439.1 MAG: hypothetical protein CSA17_02205 [bacterium DOLJORAL78_65_58]